ncbi:tripartite ATP-independent transporter DctM subunit [Mesocricetibacter intestinalis]|uniref:TRAP transporter large permease protein n=1 Tax=Mesocricetibacter intestinalis TaxID=1521930 RepID=A0A4R6V6T3_9PAST|nr:TRAP transporter large permease subunit [Mesocricetibacter intestinalis]TDQ56857.1 tripartite ATP-independent transporter DctM subunit [Mesocricetibacter intestinalis]
MTILIFLASLVGGIVIGVPIAFSLLFSGMMLMFYLGGFNSQILSQNLFNGADSFSMMAIPFFVVAGDLMNRGGLTGKIVEAATALVGHIRGGLGYVAIIAILLFASLVGSAVASTAALGAILIPMMATIGYNRDRATSLIAAGNILSPIMPPSVPMIIFGVTAGVSVTDLFMGGIAPAIYITITLCIIWAIVSRHDSAIPLPRKPFREVVRATRKAVWAILMPVGLLLGLRSGMFTPTEAGVVAVVYALIIGLFVYRELTFKAIKECFIASAKASAAIMFLAAAAMVSSWLMTIGNIPRIVTDLLHPFIDSPMLLMLVIAGLVLLIGTSMDVVPTILILTPVLMPAVKQAGINPVYFGVVFIITCVFGLLTPPVGTVLNVAASTGKINMERIVRKIWPFLLAIIIVILMLIVFPSTFMLPLEFFTK